jgi:hypothetical protein
MYSKPFDALKMAFRLQDAHTEENENICSPKNYQLYLDAFGDDASKK